MQMCSGEWEPEMTALCVNNSTMSREPIEKIGRAKHRKHIKKIRKNC